MVCVVLAGGIVVMTAVPLHADGTDHSAVRQDASLLLTHQVRSVERHHERVGLLI